MFTQDISRLLEDSKFIKTLVNDKDFSDDEQLLETDYPFIDRFYQDYSNFNLDDSRKMVDILNKLEFKQTHDFVMLTIFKHKLTNFNNRRYEFDFLFVFVKDINGNYNNNVDRLNICARFGFILTAKWLILSNIQQPTYDHIKTAIEYEQIEILDFIYNFVNITESQISEIVELTCKLDKLKSAMWIDNINSNLWIDNIMKYDSLEIAKWLYNKGYNNEINSNSKKAFINGSIKIAKWMYYTLNNRNMQIATYFDDVKLYKNYEIVKWMYNTFGLANFRENHFVYAAKYGNIRLISWFLSHTAVNDGTIQSSFILYAPNNIELANAFLTQGVIQNITLNSAFSYSDKKNIHFFELLLRTGRITDDSINISFTHNPKDNYLEFIKFLIDTDKITDESINELFEKNNGKIDIILFLLETGKITNYSLNKFFLRIAEFKNSINLAEKLLETEEIFPETINQVFITLTKEEDLELIKLLADIVTDISINELFLKTYILHNLKFLIGTGKISDETINQAFVRNYIFNAFSIIKFLIKTEKITEESINLSFAINYKNENVMDILLETGKISEKSINDIFIKDSINFSIFQKLLKTGKVNENSLNVFFRNMNGTNFLIFAKILLQTGKITDESIMFYLFNSINNDIEFVFELAENGKLNDEIIKFVKKSPEIISFLLETENLTDELLNSTFKETEDAKLIEILLKSGRVTNESIDYAFFNNDEKIVKILLKTGKVSEESKNFLFANTKNEKILDRLLDEVEVVIINNAFRKIIDDNFAKIMLKSEKITEESINFIFKKRGISPELVKVLLKTDKVSDESINFLFKNTQNAKNIKRLLKTKKVSQEWISYRKQIAKIENNIKLIEIFENIVVF